MKKLLIWDFDGVIADSEKLWVHAWDEILTSEKNIKLTKSEQDELLVGISDKLRRERLEKHVPNLVLDDDFMGKIHDREMYLGTNFMMPMDGVEKVLANNNFEHCIATGGTKAQHKCKIATPQFQWMEKYMSDGDVFTVDMVEHGKPAPDLFLLAARTKKYAPRDCIVIGDSINDFMAAKSANMDCIAFIGATGNNTPEYAAKCKTYGVFAVCKTMDAVNIALGNWLERRR